MILESEIIDQNLKFNTEWIEAPCSKLQGIFPVRKISNFISLANPAASCGECARRLVQFTFHF
jgi:hypothetical protein